MRVDGTLIAEHRKKKKKKGLGGWLSGRSEMEHYYNERRREDWEVDNCLQRELDEIVEIFEPYGLDKVSLQPLLQTLSSDKDKFVDFMMRFELNLEKPKKNRAWQVRTTLYLLRVHSNQISRAR